MACGGARAGPILPPAMREGERFAFTMCNPPFFERLEEAGRNPATAFGHGRRDGLPGRGGRLRAAHAARQPGAAGARTPCYPKCRKAPVCCLQEHSEGSEGCAEIFSVQNSCGTPAQAGVQLLLSNIEASVLIFERCKALC